MKRKKPIILAGMQVRFRENHPYGEGRTYTVALITPHPDGPSHGMARLVRGRITKFAKVHELRPAARKERYNLTASASPAATA